MAAKNIVKNTKISVDEIDDYFEVIRVDADAVVKVYASLRNNNTGIIKNRIKQQNLYSRIGL